METITFRCRRWLPSDRSSPICWNFSIWNFPICYCRRWRLGGIFRSASRIQASLFAVLEEKIEEDDDEGDGYTLPLFFIFINDGSRGEEKRRRAIADDMAFRSPSLSSGGRRRAPIFGRQDCHHWSMNSVWSHYILQKSGITGVLNAITGDALTSNGNALPCDVD